MSESASKKFERTTALQRPGGAFLREIGGFLRDNKKWWILPMLGALLLLSLLVLMTNGGLAPFIYGSQ